MASFSLSHEKESKCRSLNSPVFLKKYSRNRKLKAEALGWDGWRKKSFEFNQSLMNNFKLNSTNERENMETISGIESDCNIAQFENEPKSHQSLTQLPVNNYEASFFSDNLLATTLNLSTSTPNDTVSPYVNTSRAIFTVHLPSFQILVVNSAACQLINYSSDELCSMKLESLVNDYDKHKLSNLYEKLQKPLCETNGKLLDLVTKDGESTSVSLYLKRLDNPDKCLAIVEPIDVKTSVISVDVSGKILSCEEDIVLIFQYDAAECLGLNIYTLIPAIDLSQKKEGEWKDIKKQHVTGRTKNGNVFPLSLAIKCGNSSLDCKIVIWVYPTLNGLILLNKELSITNFNSYFIKLLFGFTKKEILNQPIFSLIPTFCQVVETERTKKCFWQNSLIKDANLSYWYGKNELDQYWSENSLVDECLGTLTSRSSLSFNNARDSSKQCSWSNASSKMDSEKDYDIKTLFAQLNVRKIHKEQDSSDFQVLLQNGDCAEEKFISDAQSNKKIGKNESGQKNKIFDSCTESNQNIAVQEGKFLGFVQHSDGSYIDIKYHVKTVDVHAESFYCIWLSRDFFKFSDPNKRSNSNILLNFNSTSFDGSLAKNSSCSGQCTKPSTASLISQCDENLTAGDYSQFYTNIRQIGKGAFGYVKMAFRNSDGLLVVTKFIKKQSVNIRSWVYHSNLNMKIPLEISLLTTLYHPNIVKVLDVFHNDSFVQLVMEKHGAGFDLFEFINRGPQCDEKLKSYIFRQIISAVHYLDSLGILHRDIKDENVIINEKFEIKLIDFGSATFMPPNETFSKFYGTVEYCSPEVLLGNSYKGPELEIWALGVTLYVLTFGENPFCNIEEIIKGQFFIPILITKELDDLLHQMLEKNVEKRITISKVAEHPWINQPVSIENYRFEEVVKCSNEEAYPPKYVHEINSEDLYTKDSRTYSNGLGDTNNSSSSLQNLTEMEDFDDNFHITQKPSMSEFVGSKTNGSAILFSSTPVQRKNERLCKSTTAIPNHSDNLLSLSHCSYECRDGSYTAYYLKHFKSTTSSEKDFSDSKEEVFDSNDVLDSELKMHFRRRLLEEEYFKVNNSSKPESFENIKEVYELLGENERFLGAENDSNNECFNPN